MRWTTSKFLPSREQDIADGLAGDAFDWSRRAEEVFDVPFTTLYNGLDQEVGSQTQGIQPHYIRLEEDSDLSDDTLRIPLFSEPRYHDRDMPRRQSYAALPAGEGHMERVFEGGSQPRRLHTLISRPDIALEDAIDTRPSEASRVDEARSAEVLQRARVLRRDMRDFVHRNSTTLESILPESTTSDISQIMQTAEPDNGASGTSNGYSNGRRRRRSFSPFDRSELGTRLGQTIRPPRRRRTGVTTSSSAIATALPTLRLIEGNGEMIGR